MAPELRARPAAFVGLPRRPALADRWRPSRLRAAVGPLSTSAGSLSDRWGRVALILLAKVFAVCSALLAALSWNFETLLVSRVFAGMSWALDCAVVLAYLAEFLPQRHQGRLNRWQGIWYVATTCNLLFAVAIFHIGVGQSIWRYSLASAGVIALILALLQLRYLPESPRWLASQGQVSKAAEVLGPVYDIDVTAGLQQKRVHARTRSGAARLADVTELFSGKLRARTILSSVTFMMQGLQYYAIGWYLPVIALAIFGQDFVAATMGAVVFNIFGIIGGFSSGPLATRFRIRRCMQVGFGGAAVVLLLLGLAFDSLPLWMAFVLPALFLLFHSAGASPGGASLAALAYPSHLRALGTGLTMALASGAAALGLFCYPLLQSSLGEGGAIAATALVPLIGLVVSSIIRWDPERQRPTDCAESAESAGRGTNSESGPQPSAL
ncbi:MFS transporter [Rhodococcus opacus]|uniref:MFS transporter n=1 Tax=Rhodococcus opacus TaxID=37919 RepID=UPI000EA8BA80|nr:MFS transporter [Rhodococcus opacus]QZS52503.1 sugar porter family MFS transporter [Rhodococcus opacus]RKM64947.1 MFS transporter [Rhodococcus opacus]